MTKIMKSNQHLSSNAKAHKQRFSLFLLYLFKASYAINKTTKVNEGVGVNVPLNCYFLKFIDNVA